MRGFPASSVSGGRWTRRTGRSHAAVSSSAGAEEYDRNVAFGPGLVRVVVGPLRRHGPPHALLVFGRPGTRPDGKDLVSDLDLHVGMRDQVLVPSGMRRRATVRRYDDVVVAVPTVDERELPGLAGLPGRRVKDEAVRAVPVVPHLAAGGLVLSDVLVAKQTVVRHAARVPRPRSGGDPPSSDGRHRTTVDHVFASVDRGCAVGCEE